MKKTLILLLGIIFLVSFQTGASAQTSKGWMDKMKSEKIGFLTSEVGITAEEAQAFWPVYNKAEEERRVAMEKVFSSYNELKKAVREKRSEKEIKDCLNAYIDASQKSETIDAKYVSQYEKVLSPAKVAKLFIAEEDFRELQIMKLEWNRRSPQPAVSKPAK